MSVMPDDVIGLVCDSNSACDHNCICDSDNTCDCDCDCDCDFARDRLIGLIGRAPRQAEYHQGSNRLAAYLLR